jgi:transposase-like protein
MKQKYVSIRKNSFFASFNLELVQVFKICYAWFTNRPIIEVTRDFKILKSIVLKIYKMLSEQTIKYFEENPLRFGGNNVICQIDESMFRYKQKYHVGRISQVNRWVFGIVDTSTTPAKYFVKVVVNRTSEALLPIICQVCRPGTIIWSDEWRSYNRLNSLGFIHSTVNHRLNFVDPNTGVNTQTVESLWNKLKRRVKKCMGLSL